MELEHGQALPARVAFEEAVQGDRCGSKADLFAPSPTRFARAPQGGCSLRGRKMKCRPTRWLHSRGDWRRGSGAIAQSLYRALLPTHRGPFSRFGRSVMVDFSCRTRARPPSGAHVARRNPRHSYHFGDYTIDTPEHTQNLKRRRWGQPQYAVESFGTSPAVYARLLQHITLQLRAR